MKAFSKIPGGCPTECADATRYILRKGAAIACCV